MPLPAVAAKLPHAWVCDMRRTNCSIVRAAEPLGALGGLALLGSCAVASAPAASPYELELRSAFDLDCPAAWVHTYQLDERTVGAAGCGRRLTYVETCEQERGAERCTWVADGASALERAMSAYAACAPKPQPSAAPATAALPSAPGALPAAPASAASPIDPFAERH